jgi:phosphoribosyl 1,2-cyclic phosphate phosphodiesterase
VSLRITLLGTGTSQGVPMIGCDCSVCQSSDPRDKRSRPSILIELRDASPSDAATGFRRTSESDLPSGTGRRSEISEFAAATKFILVDTSSDLRMQALTTNVLRIDAILFTHSHADHVFGLDDVRRFNKMQKATIPCYADELTLRDVRRTFSYIFDTDTPKGGGLPKITLTRVGGTFSLGGRDIVPVPVMHGARPILGYRIGSFAYLTDCSFIPDTSWPLLDGVRTLVIDALRERPHSTHFNVEQALAAAARIGAERTYFTHISHDLGHAATCARLPRGVELAYDGLILETPD